MDRQDHFSNPRYSSPPTSNSPLHPSAPLPNPPTLSPETFLNRLRMLQSNASRLLSQHQALLPLLPLRTLLPTLHQQSSSLLPLSSRLSALKQALSPFNPQTHMQLPSSTSSTPDLKKVFGEILETRGQVQELQKEMERVDKGELWQMKMRGIGVNKEVEGNLERLRGDVECFVEEFEGGLAAKFKGEMWEGGEGMLVEEFLGEILGEEEGEWEGELENVKREMGMLVCEVEFVKDRELRQQLANPQQPFPPLPSSEFPLALTEYNFLSDYVYLCSSSNFERFKYQFSLLHTEMQKIPRLMSDKLQDAQIALCKGRLRELREEIEGGQEKMRGEMMRLEGKLERIRWGGGGEEGEGGERGVREMEEELGHRREMAAKHAEVMEKYVDETNRKFQDIQRYL